MFLSGNVTPHSFSKTVLCSRISELWETLLWEPKILQKLCHWFVCLFVCLSVPPSIYPPEDEIHIVSANQSQSLSCLVSGYPTPWIQWHRDGVHVDSDMHLRYGLRVSIEGFLCQLVHYWQETLAYQHTCNCYTCTSKHCCTNSVLDVLCIKIQTTCHHIMQKRENNVLHAANIIISKVTR